MQSIECMKLFHSFCNSCFFNLNFSLNDSNDKVKNVKPFCTKLLVHFYYLLFTFNFAKAYQQIFKVGNILGKVNSGFRNIIKTLKFKTI